MSILYTGVGDVFWGKMSLSVVKPLTSHVSNVCSDITSSISRKMGTRAHSGASYHLRSTRTLEVSGNS